MKRLGITQRVEHIERYNERRDCLDQRWSSFAFELGYIPVPLPNIPADKVSDLLDNLNLDAILLSGGNSIALTVQSATTPPATDTAPERDAFESALLDNALDHKIPLLGVCRGMQMINLYLGGTLSPINEHVAVRHPLRPLKDCYQLPYEVNSYHNWGIGTDNLAKELTAIALDSDGNVEAFEHQTKKLFGIMWHPERELPFNTLDIQIIKRFLL